MGGIRRDLRKDVERYAEYLRRLISKIKALKEIDLVETLYYNAIVLAEKKPEKYKEQKEYFDKLRSRLDQFEIKLGDLIKIDERYRQKGVDALVAIDMITKAYLNHYDVALLVAGDRDFVNIVKAVKEYTGKLVYGVCEKDRSKHTLKS